MEDQIRKAIESRHHQVRDGITKGVYANNSQNKKLGRVGQQYGGGGDKETEDDGGLVESKPTKTMLMFIKGIKSMQRGALSKPYTTKELHSMDFTMLGMVHATLTRM